MDGFPAIEKPAVVPSSASKGSQSPSSAPAATLNVYSQAIELDRENELNTGEKHARMRAYVQTVLNERAPYSYTFRYPPSLLEKLESTLDYIQRRFRRKLHKNAIPVLALAYLLWDFEANDTDSLLYKELVLKQS